MGSRPLPARHGRRYHSRTAIVGTSPNEAASERLVGTVLLENNEEWLTPRRQMPREAMAKIRQPQSAEPAVLSIATARASANNASPWLPPPRSRTRPQFAARVGEHRQGAAARLRHSSDTNTEGGHDDRPIPRPELGVGQRGDGHGHEHGQQATRHRASDAADAAGRLRHSRRCAACGTANTEDRHDRRSAPGPE